MPNVAPFSLVYKQAHELIESAGAFRVYSVLCLYFNWTSDMPAWPSLETIAHMAKMSSRQVRTHLRTLENQGLVKTTSTRGGPNHYHINVEVKIRVEENCTPELGFRGTPEADFRQTYQDKHTPPPPPSGDPPPRLSSMTCDWEPSFDHHEFAAKKGLTDEDADGELEKFRDYFADKGERRKGWDGSFRNWLRKSAENGYRGNGSHRGRQRNGADEEYGPLLTAARRVAARRASH